MRTLLLGCIMSLSLFSCKKQLRDNQEKIDNDLLITMIGDTSKYLMLHVETQKQFSCSNYMVDLGHQATGNDITIQFNRAELYGPCLTSFGPATNDIVLGELQQGSYSLILKCNGNTATVPLTVSADKYSVKDASGKFFKFTNTEISR